VNIEGALTWAFEFENEPYFFGQRVLATNGIDLPILDLFRMYAKLDGQRVATTSTQAMTVDSIMRSGVRGQPDVSAISTLGKNQLCVLAWHYHDDDVPGPAANVTLDLTGLPAGVTQAKVTEYRIDDTIAIPSPPGKIWARRKIPPPRNTPSSKPPASSKQFQTSTAPPPHAAHRQRPVFQKYHPPRQSVSLLVLDWSAPSAQYPALKTAP